MGRLREIVGDDPIGYAATIMANGAPKVDEELGRQMRRYQEECGPVTVRPLIEWCEPKQMAVTGFDIPLVHVGKTELTLNRLAVEALGGPERIKIGVLYDGRLVMRPAQESDPAAFRVSPQRRQAKGARPCAASVGGRRAVRWLLEKHIEPGHYRIAYDEQFGVWVGTKQGG